MKEKGSRGKGSLQKTASSLINIHTHRNSTINETVPFYHESFASINTKVLKSKEPHSQSYHTHTKKSLRGSHHQKSKKERQHSRESRDCRRLNGGEQGEPKSKKRKPLVNLYSENWSMTKPQVSRQIQPCSSQILLEEEWRSGWLMEESQLLGVLRRTKNTLDSYRLYSQQLELDCKRIRRKYNEAIAKIKKYQRK